MTRNNLMICCASERSMHYAWLDGDRDHRNWDLYLAPYRPVLPAYSHDIKTDQIRYAKKFSALHDLLTRDQWWRDYRNVMLVDEDVFAMPGTWSRFFDVADTLDMTMAAPALTPNSVHSHPVTVQQPGCRMRRVSFIESMMPCFRADTLSTLLPTFMADPTGAGWGLDYVWAKLLDYRGIYVIDETPVTHWRPNVYDRSYWPETDAVLAKFDARMIEQTYEVFR
jgi:hypothetical protein